MTSLLRIHKFRVYDGMWFLVKFVVESKRENSSVTTVTWCVRPAGREIEGDSTFNIIIQRQQHKQTADSQMTSLKISLNTSTIILYYFK